ncbi:hypothetical protein AA313_de0209249 [Arthrobotrys entomopaga]|nr:hypothetical protein AA313_de0209249 [Arthrobotrys entomopaga]
MERPSHSPARMILDVRPRRKRDIHNFLRTFNASDENLSPYHLPQIPHDDEDDHEIPTIKPYHDYPINSTTQVVLNNLPPIPHSSTSSISSKISTLSEINRNQVESTEQPHFIDAAQVSQKLLSPTTMVPKFHNVPLPITIPCSPQSEILPISRRDWPTLTLPPEDHFSPAWAPTTIEIEQIAPIVILSPVDEQSHAVQEPLQDNITSLLDETKSMTGSLPSFLAPNDVPFNLPLSHSRTPPFFDESSLQIPKTSDTYPAHPQLWESVPLPKSPSLYSLEPASMADPSHRFPNSRSTSPLDAVLFHTADNEQISDQFFKPSELSISARPSSNHRLPPQDVISEVEEFPPTLTDVSSTRFPEKRETKYSIIENLPVALALPSIASSINSKDLPGGAGHQMLAPINIPSVFSTLPGLEIRSPLDKGLAQIHINNRSHYEEVLPLHSDNGSFSTVNTELGLPKIDGFYFVNVLPESRPISPEAIGFHPKETHQQTDDVGYASMHLPESKSQTPEIPFAVVTSDTLDNLPTSRSITPAPSIASVVLTPIRSPIGMVDNPGLLIRKHRPSSVISLPEGSENSPTNLPTSIPNSPSFHPPSDEAILPHLQMETAPYSPSLISQRSLQEACRSLGLAAPVANVPEASQFVAQTPGDLSIVELDHLPESVPVSPASVRPVIDKVRALAFSESNGYSPYLAPLHATEQLISDIPASIPMLSHQESSSLSLLPSSPQSSVLPYDYRDLALGTISHFPLLPHTRAATIKSASDLAGPNLPDRSLTTGLPLSDGVHVDKPRISAGDVLLDPQYVPDLDSVSNSLPLLAGQNSIPMARTPVATAEYVILPDSRIGTPKARFSRATFDPSDFILPAAALSISDQESNLSLEDFISRVPSVAAHEFHLPEDTCESVVSCDPTRINTISRPFLPASEFSVYSTSGLNAIPRESPIARVIERCLPVSEPQTPHLVPLLQLKSHDVPSLPGTVFEHSVVGEYTHLIEAPEQRFGSTKPVAESLPDLPFSANSSTMAKETHVASEIADSLPESWVEDSNHRTPLKSQIICGTIQPKVSPRHAALTIEHAALPPSEFEYDLSLHSVQHKDLPPHSLPVSRSGTPVPLFESSVSSIAVQESVEHNIALPESPLSASFENHGLWDEAHQRSLPFSNIASPSLSVVRLPLIPQILPETSQDVEDVSVEYEQPDVLPQRLPENTDLPSLPGSPTSFHHPTDRQIPAPDDFEPNYPALPQSRLGSPRMVPIQMLVPLSPERSGSPSELHKGRVQEMSNASSDDQYPELPVSPPLSPKVVCDNSAPSPVSQPKDTIRRNLEYFGLPSSHVASPYTLPATDALGANVHDLSKDFELEPAVSALTLDLSVVELSSENDLKTAIERVLPGSPVESHEFGDHQFDVRLASLPSSRLEVPIRSPKDAQISAPVIDLSSLVEKTLPASCSSSPSLGPSQTWIPHLPLSRPPTLAGVPHYILADSEIAGARAALPRDLSGAISEPLELTRNGEAVALPESILSVPDFSQHDHDLRLHHDLFSSHRVPTSHSASIYASPSFGPSASPCASCNFELPLSLTSSPAPSTVSATHHAEPALPLSRSPSLNGRECVQMPPVPQTSLTATEKFALSPHLDISEHAPYYLTSKLPESSPPSILSQYMPIYIENANLPSDFSDDRITNHGAHDIPPPSSGHFQTSLPTSIPPSPSCIGLDIGGRGAHLHALPTESALSLFDTTHDTLGIGNRTLQPAASGVEYVLPQSPIASTIHIRRGPEHSEEILLPETSSTIIDIAERGQSPLVVTSDDTILENFALPSSPRSLASLHPYLPQSPFFGLPRSPPHSEYDLAGSPAQEIYGEDNTSFEGRSHTDFPLELPRSHPTTVLFHPLNDPSIQLPPSRTRSLIDGVANSPSVYHAFYPASSEEHPVLPLDPPDSLSAILSFDQTFPEEVSALPLSPGFSSVRAMSQDCESSKHLDFSHHIPISLPPIRPHTPGLIQNPASPFVSQGLPDSHLDSPLETLILTPSPVLRKQLHEKAFPPIPGSPVIHEADDILFEVNSDEDFLPGSSLGSPYTLRAKADATLTAPVQDIKIISKETERLENPKHEEQLVLPSSPLQRAISPIEPVVADDVNYAITLPQSYPGSPSLLPIEPPLHRYKIPVPKSFKQRIPLKRLVTSYSDITTDVPGGTNQQQGTPRINLEGLDPVLEIRPEIQNFLLPSSPQEASIASPEEKPSTPTDIEKFIVESSPQANINNFNEGDIDIGNFLLDSAAEEERFTERDAVLSSPSEQELSIPRVPEDDINSRVSEHLHIHEEDSQEVVRDSRLVADSISEPSIKLGAFLQDDIQLPATAISSPLNDSELETLETTSSLGEIDAALLEIPASSSPRAAAKPERPSHETSYHGPQLLEVPWPIQEMSPLSSNPSTPSMPSQTFDGSTYPETQARQPLVTSLEKSYFQRETELPIFGLLEPPHVIDELLPPVSSKTWSKPTPSGLNIIDELFPMPSNRATPKTKTTAESRNANESGAIEMNAENETRETRQEAVNSSPMQSPTAHNPPIVPASPVGEQIEHDLPWTGDHYTLSSALSEDDSESLYAPAIAPRLDCVRGEENLSILPWDLHEPVTNLPASTPRTADNTIAFVPAPPAQGPEIGDIVRQEDCIQQDAGDDSKSFHDQNLYKTEERSEILEDPTTFSTREIYSDEESGFEQPILSYELTHANSHEVFHYPSSPRSLVDEALGPEMTVDQTTAGASISLSPRSLSPVLSTVITERDDHTKEQSVHSDGPWSFSTSVAEFEDEGVQSDYEEQDNNIEFPFDTNRPTSPPESVKGPSKVVRFADQNEFREFVPEDEESSPIESDLWSVSETTSDSGTAPLRDSAPLVEYIAPEHRLESAKARDPAFQPSFSGLPRRADQGIDDTWESQNRKYDNTGHQLRDIELYDPRDLPEVPNFEQRIGDASEQQLSHRDVAPRSQSLSPIPGKTKKQDRRHIIVTKPIPHPRDPQETPESQNLTKLASPRARKHQRPDKPISDENKGKTKTLSPVTQNQKPSPPSPPVVKPKYDKIPVLPTKKQTPQATPSVATENGPPTISVIPQKTVKVKSKVDSDPQPKATFKADTLPPEIVTRLPKAKPIVAKDLSEPSRPRRVPESKRLTLQIPQVPEAPKLQKRRSFDTIESARRVSPERSTPFNQLPLRIKTKTRKPSARSLSPQARKPLSEQPTPTEQPAHLKGHSRGESTRRFQSPKLAALPLIPALASLFGKKDGDSQSDQTRDYSRSSPTVQPLSREPENIPRAREIPKEPVHIIHAIPTAVERIVAPTREEKPTKLRREKRRPRSTSPQKAHATIVPQHFAPAETPIIAKRIRSVSPVKVTTIKEAAPIERENKVSAIVLTPKQPQENRARIKSTSPKPRKLKVRDELHASHKRQEVVERPKKPSRRHSESRDVGIDIPQLAFAALLGKQERGRKATRDVQQISETIPTQSSSPDKHPKHRAKGASVYQPLESLPAIKKHRSLSPRPRQRHASVDIALTAIAPREKRSHKRHTRTSPQLLPVEISSPPVIAKLTSEPERKRERRHRKTARSLSPGLRTPLQTLPPFVSSQPAPDEYQSFARSAKSPVANQVPPVIKSHNFVKSQPIPVLYPEPTSVSHPEPTAILHPEFTSRPNLVLRTEPTLQEEQFETSSEYFHAPRPDEQSSLLDQPSIEHQKPRYIAEYHDTPVSHQPLIKHSVPENVPVPPLLPETPAPEIIVPDTAALETAVPYLPLAQRPPQISAEQRRYEVEVERATRLEREQQALDVLELRDEEAAAKERQRLFMLYREQAERYEREQQLIAEMDEKERFENDKMLYQQYLVQKAQDERHEREVDLRDRNRKEDMIIAIERKKEAERRRREEYERERQRQEEERKREYEMAQERAAFLEREQQRKAEIQRLALELQRREEERARLLEEEKLAEEQHQIRIRTLAEEIQRRETERLEILESKEIAEQQRKDEIQRLATEIHNRELDRAILTERREDKERAKESIEREEVERQIIEARNLQESLEKQQQIDREVEQESRRRRLAEAAALVSVAGSVVGSNASTVGSEVSTKHRFPILGVDDSLQRPRQRYYENSMYNYPSSDASSFISLGQPGTSSSGQRAVVERPSNESLQSIAWAGAGYTQAQPDKRDSLQSLASWSEASWSEDDTPKVEQKEFESDDLSDSSQNEVGSTESLLTPVQRFREPLEFPFLPNIATLAAQHPTSVVDETIYDKDGYPVASTAESVYDKDGNRIQSIVQSLSPEQNITLRLLGHETAGDNFSILHSDHPVGLHAPLPSSTQPSPVVREIHDEPHLVPLRLPSPMHSITQQPVNLPERHLGEHRPVLASSILDFELPASRPTTSHTANLPSFFHLATALPHSRRPSFGIEESAHKYDTPTAKSVQNLESPPCFDFTTHQPIPDSRAASPVFLQPSLPTIGVPNLPASAVDSQYDESVLDHVTTPLPVFSHPEEFRSGETQLPHSPAASLLGLLEHKELETYALPSSRSTSLNNYDNEMQVESRPVFDFDDFEDLPESDEELGVELEDMFTPPSAAVLKLPESRISSIYSLHDAYLLDTSAPREHENIPLPTIEPNEDVLDVEQLGRGVWESVCSLPASRYESTYAPSMGIVAIEGVEQPSDIALPSPHSDSGGESFIVPKQRSRSVVSLPLTDNHSTYNVTSYVSENQAFRDVLLPKDTGSLYSEALSHPYLRADNIVHQLPASRATSEYENIDKPSDEDGPNYLYGLPPVHDNDGLTDYVLDESQTPRSPPAVGRIPSSSWTSPYAASLALARSLFGDIPTLPESDASSRHVETPHERQINELDLPLSRRSSRYHHEEFPKLLPREEIFEFEDNDSRPSSSHTTKAFLPREDEIRLPISRQTSLYLHESSSQEQPSTARVTSPQLPDSRSSTPNSRYLAHQHDEPRELPISRASSFYLQEPRNEPTAPFFEKAINESLPDSQPPSSYTAIRTKARLLPHLPVTRSATPEWDHDDDDEVDDLTPKPSPRQLAREIFGHDIPSDLLLPISQKSSLASFHDVSGPRLVRDLPESRPSSSYAEAEASPRMKPISELPIATEEAALSTPIVPPAHSSTSLENSLAIIPRVDPEPVSEGPPEDGLRVPGVPRDSHSITPTEIEEPEDTLTVFQPRQAVARPRSPSPRRTRHSSSTQRRRQNRRRRPSLQEYGLGAVRVATGDLDSHTAAAGIDVHFDQETGTIEVSWSEDHFGEAPTVDISVYYPGDTDESFHGSDPSPVIAPTPAFDNYMLGNQPQPIEASSRRDDLDLFFSPELGPTDTPVISSPRAALPVNRTLFPEAISSNSRVIGLGIEGLSSTEDQEPPKLQSTDFNPSSNKRAALPSISIPSRKEIAASEISPARSSAISLSGASSVSPLESTHDRLLPSPIHQLPRALDISQIPTEQPKRFGADTFTEADNQALALLFSAGSTPTPRNPQLATEYFRKNPTPVTPTPRSSQNRQTPHSRGSAARRSNTAVEGAYPSPETSPDLAPLPKSPETPKSTPRLRRLSTSAGPSRRNSTAKRYNSIAGDLEPLQEDIAIVPSAIFDGVGSSTTPRPGSPKATPPILTILKRRATMDPLREEFRSNMDGSSSVKISPTPAAPRPRNPSTGPRTRASSMMDSPNTMTTPASPFTYDNTTIASGSRKGKERATIYNSEVFEAYGDTSATPLSPDRPMSVNLRKRQSLQLMDLETRIRTLNDQNTHLSGELSRLQQESASSEKKVEAIAYKHLQERSALVEALEIRSLAVSERESQIETLKKNLEWYKQEDDNLAEQLRQLRITNEQLAASEAAQRQQYERKREQLHTLSQQHSDLQEQYTALSSGLNDIINQQIATVAKAKDGEIEKLKQELAAAKSNANKLQVKLNAMNRYIDAKDEVYFARSCGHLFNAVQQWCVKFSKFSDTATCVSFDTISDDSVKDLVESVVLDGSDFKAMLRDRVRRREIFMAMAMSLIWELIFCRYLFGLESEERQKLKALEEKLNEVGPPAAVHLWRATTLQLLSQRRAFRAALPAATEPVVQEIYRTLAILLPPPRHLEQQVIESLRTVIDLAVTLSIDMRTQRAEYFMWEAPDNSIGRPVDFVALRMNNRGNEGLTNDQLEQMGAVVRVVLFPLVTKRGDENGDGYDVETVIAPMQVLVSKPPTSRNSSKRVKVDQ